MEENTWVLIYGISFLNMVLKSDDGPTHLNRMEEQNILIVHF